LAWELRIATSFASLRRIQGNREQAVVELRTVLDRLTEGFETVDTVKAQTLLLELSASR
jgi:hypothetical protein